MCVKVNVLFCLSPVKSKKLEWEYSKIAIK